MYGSIAGHEAHVGVDGRVFGVDFNDVVKVLLYLTRYVSDIKCHVLLIARVIFKDELEGRSFAAGVIDRIGQNLFRSPVCQLRLDVVQYESRCRVGRVSHNHNLRCNVFALDSGIIDRNPRLNLMDAVRKHLDSISDRIGNVYLNRCFRINWRADVALYLALAVNLNVEGFADCATDVIRKAHYTVGNRPFPLCSKCKAECGLRDRKLQIARILPGRIAFYNQSDLLRACVQHVCNVDRPPFSRGWRGDGGDILYRSACNPCRLRVKTSLDGKRTALSRWLRGLRDRVKFFRGKSDVDFDCVVGRDNVVGRIGV